MMRRGTHGKQQLASLSLTLSLPTRPPHTHTHTHPDTHTRARRGVGVGVGGVRAHTYGEVAIRGHLPVDAKGHGPLFGKHGRDHSVLHHINICNQGHGNQGHGNHSVLHHINICNQGHGNQGHGNHSVLHHINICARHGMVEGDYC